ncbi:MAG TPA: EamA family transporter [Thermoleophilaceae bacterium]|nr:EamA family transporter [Thermoleophilaceae bacterium]
MGSGLLDHEPRWLGPLALGTIYVVWGSTYLAIRVMVEDIPPLLGAGARFVVAGGLLYAWVAVRRPPSARRLTRRQLAGAAVVGVLLMVGGNGLVTVAEQEVPSGLAALLIASEPLWVILLRAGFGRERVPGTTLLSIAVGFVGVALLVLPAERPEDAPLSWSMLVVLAALLWALGSFVASRLERPPDLLATTAWQMLIGGGVMIALGLALGEAADLRLSDVSADAWAALIFLIFVGSIAAFTAYNWLLQHVAISTVSTYAFVNPVIAVFLGWLILSEEITGFVVLGTAVIVAAVAFVVLSPAERAPVAPER